MTGQPHLSLHAVNIYVRDQERSLRFYVDQLGFKVAFDATLHTGQRWVAVSPPDGSAVLSLIAPEPGTLEHKWIGRVTHVVLVTEDVIRKFHEWSHRGVPFKQTPRLRRMRYQTGGSSNQSIWGAVTCRFEDPDKNVFSLISFDAVSRGIEERRREAAERLEAERRAVQELEIAKQVQARLFPQTKPVLLSLDYAGYCIQARQVGGDYYDYLQLGPGRLGLVVGDVAGKGIAAALLMANLQANFRSQCMIALDEPHRVLSSVNRIFCDNSTDSAYATLFFAVYDDASGRLVYANCGHLPGLIVRRGGHVDRLQSTATVLGLFRDWECEIAEHHLAPGDTLALYTDGVTECCDSNDQEFGEERLTEALLRGRSSAPAALLESVLNAVRVHNPGEQQDDVTLILAARR